MNQDDVMQLLSLTPSAPTTTTTINHTTNNTTNNNNNKKKKKKSTNNKSKQNKKNTGTNNSSTTTASKLEEERKHEERMDKQLAQMGLKRKSIAKDGSCLFRACSDLLFNTQSYHGLLRDMCVRFVEMNRNHFEPFIFDMSFAKYCKWMRLPNTWAGQLELEVMAQCFQCNITVYSIRGIEAEHTFDANSGLVGANRKRRRAGKDSFTVPSIALCFLHGNHYDAVYSESFFDVAGMCQDIFYQSVLKKGMGIEDASTRFTSVYKNYRNVEYESYIEEIRMQNALDQELARQMEEERLRRAKEQEKQTQEDEDDEEETTSNEPYEVKTVVATGRVITSEEQYSTNHLVPWGQQEQEQQQQQQEQEDNNEGNGDSIKSIQQEGEYEMGSEGQSGGNHDLTVTSKISSSSTNKKEQSHQQQQQQQNGKSDIVKKSLLPLPDHWSEFSEGFDPVPGTRLIPIKAPLNSRLYHPNFNLIEFCEKQNQEAGRKIGLIIDLSNVDIPFYDYRVDVPQGIPVLKLSSSADIGPPSEYQIQQFLNHVDHFLLSTTTTTSTQSLPYILVHCTYGVNRTGVFICEYLIRRCACTVEQALKAFALGRKCAIYQPLFIDELFHRHDQQQSNMYKTFTYPGFPSFVKDTYIQNVKRAKLLEKRLLSFETFNFDGMRPFDDLKQFDSIELPPAMKEDEKKIILNMNNKKTKKKAKNKKNKKQQNNKSDTSTGTAAIKRIPPQQQQQQQIAPTATPAASLWSSLVADSDLTLTDQPAITKPNTSDKKNTAAATLTTTTTTTTTSTTTSQPQQPTIKKPKKNSNNWVTPGANKKKR